MAALSVATADLVAKQGPLSVLSIKEEVRSHTDDEALKRTAVPGPLNRSRRSHPINPVVQRKKEVMPPKIKVIPRRVRVSVLAQATQRREPAARTKANPAKPLRPDSLLQTATNRRYGSIKKLFFVLIEHT